MNHITHFLIYLTIFTSSTKNALIILFFKADALKTPPYGRETVLCLLASCFKLVGLILLRPFKTTLKFESEHVAALVFLFGY